jgi:hypothetical protein
MANVWLITYRIADMHIEATWNTPKTTGWRRRGGAAR